MTTLGHAEAVLSAAEKSGMPPIVRLATNARAASPEGWEYWTFAWQALEAMVFSVGRKEPTRRPGRSLE